MMRNVVTLMTKTPLFAKDPVERILLFHKESFCHLLAAFCLHKAALKKQRAR